ncbi:hypothetical protein JCGZ_09343 [Jatropha curcas]|uniref:Uncharacterized protein n=1 Tax=Jatropha curcas TaxID=180498 RepID=A0A067KNA4_JATCU|nr:hypothetical protein JCGZ_09343 [Jatropha curcas]
MDEEKDKEDGEKKMSKGDEGDEDKDEEGKVKWKSRGIIHHGSIPTIKASKGERPKEVLEAKRAKRVLSNSDFKITSQGEKAPRTISWSRTNSWLIKIEEPSTPSDLPSSASSSPLGFCFEIENSPVRTDSPISASTIADRMAKSSVHLSEMEKMMQRIVASSLEKLMRFDKGKEKVVIEDDGEAKGESEKKEHVDNT